MLIWIASIIVLALFTSGCSAKYVPYRLFFVEDPQAEKLVNYKGEECKASGQDIDPVVYEGNAPEKIVITTTYSNCDIKTFRYLTDRERPMWGIDHERVDRIHREGQNKK
jgi:hypothetical protein